jgi:hypothetical protein
VVERENQAEVIAAEARIACADALLTPYTVEDGVNGPPSKPRGRVAGQRA